MTCCDDCLVRDCPFRCGFTYKVCEPYGKCKDCKDFIGKETKEDDNNGDAKLVD